MKNILKLFVLTLVLSSSLAFAAMSVDAAKQQGLVGERPDGMLGAVAASADAQALVKQINAERLAKYQEIAGKNGAPVSQIQAIAGKKLIDSAKSGEYIMNAAGGWQKK